MLRQPLGRSSLCRIRLRPDMDAPASERLQDDEWADARRLRLLRRRRLIAALALLGVVILIALSIFERANSADSAHDKGTGSTLGPSGRGYADARGTRP
jgi:hypothetical protein